MRAWIISIIGIVFLSIILEIIIPNNKSKKLIETIISIFFMLLFFAPLINNINKVSSSNYQIDENFIKQINNAKMESLILRIKNDLKRNGILNVEIEIVEEAKNMDFCVKYIYVNTSKMSLSEGSSHKNINEDILSVIVSLVNIDKEKILIYGT